MTISGVLLLLRVLYLVGVGAVRVICYVVGQTHFPSAIVVSLAFSGMTARWWGGSALPAFKYQRVHGFDNGVHGVDVVPVPPGPRGGHKARVASSDQNPVGGDFGS